MTFELLMRDNYKRGVADAEAKAEARAQKAIAKALKETAKAQEEIAKAKEKEICNIKNFYSQGLSVENIAKGFSISEAEVRNILSVK